MLRTLVLCCLLLTLIAADRPPGPVAPSVNQGRIGIYQVATTFAGYNYYVSVPTSYDGTAPAGLHLFFHGQNNQGAAKEWDRWKPFLEPHRLIGINMEFTDGDNGRDQAGKVKATQEAIAQVMADYKIVLRGAISCFSGGGAIHGLMAELHSKTRSPAWPFCHSTIYSATYGRDPAAGVPMSWCITVGLDEWTLAELGRISVARTNDLYLATAKGGSPDIRYFLTPKGHTIPAEDIAASVASFTISDLAFGEFLYAPDFSEKELRTIVEQANRLQLATAAAAVTRLLGKTSLSDTLRAKATTLQQAIDARVTSVLTLLGRLPQDDPVLAAWYGPLFIAQLKGHDEEKALKAALTTALKRKETQATLAAHAELARQFSALFGPAGSNPGVVADKRALLTTLQPHLPAGSRAGLIVAELLALGR